MGVQPSASFVNLVSRGPPLHPSREEIMVARIWLLSSVSTSSLLGLYGDNVMLPAPISNGCEGGIHRSRCRSRCRVVENRRHMMAFCSSCA